MALIIHVSEWKREQVRHLLFPTNNTPEGFLTEYRKYELSVSQDGQPLPSNARITVNELPASRIDRLHDSIFQFAIDSYAGQIRIALICGCRILEEIDVVVDPDVAKMTTHDYLQMVREIASATRALYRFGQTAVPAVGGPDNDALDLATLELLRAYFERFARAVERVADQPIRGLASTGVSTPIMRARNVTERAIDRALRAGRWRRAADAEIRAAPKLVAALGGRWIPAIVEARKCERLDLYENRAILGFLKWLGSVIRALVYRLSALDKPSNPELVALWLERLKRYQRHVDELLSRDVFSDLIPENALHATSVFRMHPDYAAAFRAMMDIRSGVGSSGRFVGPIPIDRTYKLYELWCYICLLKAVSDHFPGSRESIARALIETRSPSDLAIELAQGTGAKIELASGITLTYQRLFSQQPASDGTRTLVVDAIPDVTISTIDEMGRCVGIVILDPKYRAGASLADGLRDLHAYRDAILDSNGRRIILGAVALAPRLPQTDPPLSFRRDAPMAIEARPGFAESVFPALLSASLRTLGRASA